MKAGLVAAAPAPSTQFEVFVDQDWRDQNGFQLWEVASAIEIDGTATAREWLCSKELEPKGGFELGHQRFIPRQASVSRRSGLFGREGTAHTRVRVVHMTTNKGPARVRRFVEIEEEQARVQKAYSKLGKSPDASWEKAWAPDDEEGDALLPWKAVDNEDKVVLSLSRRDWPGPTPGIITTSSQHPSYILGLAASWSGEREKSEVLNTRMLSTYGLPTSCFAEGTSLPHELCFPTTPRSRKAQREAGGSARRAPRGAKQRTASRQILQQQERQSPVPPEGGAATTDATATVSTTTAASASRRRPEQAPPSKPGEVADSEGAGGATTRPPGRENDGGVPGGRGRRGGGRHSRRTSPGSTSTPVESAPAADVSLVPSIVEEPPPGANSEAGGRGMQGGRRGVPAAASQEHRPPKGDAAVRSVHDDDASEKPEPRRAKRERTLGKGREECGEATVLDALQRHKGEVPTRGGEGRRALEGSTQQRRSSWAIQVTHSGDGRHYVVHEELNMVLQGGFGLLDEKGACLGGFLVLMPGTQRAATTEAGQPRLRRGSHD